MVRVTWGFHANKVSILPEPHSQGVHDWPFSDITKMLSLDLFHLEILGNLRKHFDLVTERLKRVIDEKEFCYAIYKQAHVRAFFTFSALS
jgi:hypothetical protein